MCTCYIGHFCVSYDDAIVPNLSHLQTTIHVLFVLHGFKCRCISVIKSAGFSSVAILCNLCNRTWRMICSWHVDGISAGPTSKACGATLVHVAGSSRNVLHIKRAAFFYYAILTSHVFDEQCQLITSIWAVCFGAHGPF